MKKLSCILMALVLGLASTSFALDPILMGDFENGSTPDGTNFRWDSWMVNSNDTSAVDVPAVAATRGTHSLKWVDADGGSWLASDISYPYGGTMSTQFEALLDPGCVITVDVTAIPAEVPGEWADISIFYNAAGGWGFDDTLWQSVIIDGVPHTYEFVVTDNIRNVINLSIGGWGCNLGFALRTADSTAITIYLDNIWIWPDGPDAYKFPRNSSFDENFAGGDTSDITLNWDAATMIDPVDPNFLLPVHPDIVDQYVFLADTASSDPNLYYIGSTGDPGLTDPSSSLGPITLPVNSVYRWQVVEIMDGHVPSPAFATGSTVNDIVDPNNIIGPVWTFKTKSTVPEIRTQPVSTRFGIDDASAVFTIDVDEVFEPEYQWYYSTDNVIDAGDTALTTLGGTTNTLTITNHNKAYQAYFYCRVANGYTESGAAGTGEAPDVFSDVVSLAVERKVAEYVFDGNLNDTSTMALHGTGVGSPTFVTGVGGVGSALSLDGSSQYVEVTNGFPRADLFTNVAGGAGTESGFGGGLDVGTIMCWVKLNATAANQVSPIVYNGNAGWPHTEYRFDIVSDAAAANTNLTSNIWGVATDASGNAVSSYWMNVNPPYADPFNMGGDGQWHMLALTWDMNGSVKSYLDGNMLAEWDASANRFTAWDATTKIGYDGTNYFGGAIDNLRVYNYEISAEEVVAEYYAVTGKPGCINLGFDGSNLDVNQLGSSYCRVDLADFAELAANWLNDGFFTPVP